jgi:hypothetical protein
MEPLSKKIIILFIFNWLIKTHPYKKEHQKYSLPQNETSGLIIALRFLGFNI